MRLSVYIRRRFSEGKILGLSVKNARKLLVLLTFAMLGATTAAEQRGEVTRIAPPPQAVKFLAPWRPAGAGTETRVVGTVIDIRQVPVSFARVQLRDLKTGLVVASVDTNEKGEYQFELGESGTYVVEMVMVDNYIIGLSNAGSLDRYETLQTVIQLPGRWDFAARAMIMPVGPTSFFGIGSSNTMTSTTIALAGDKDVRPIEVGLSVSPK